MKTRVVTGLMIVLIFISIFTLSGWTSAKKLISVAFSKNNLIRLHVIANSNQSVDQRVKLLVRDRVLQESDKILAVTKRDDALKLLQENKDYLTSIVINELNKNGFYYPAHIEIGDFEFPDKEYEFGLLPAGKYLALRVILGQGDGKNWWCVLFPPVCHLSTEKDNEELDKRDTKNIKFRWLALEKLLAEKGKVKEKTQTGLINIFELATGPINSGS